MDNLNLKIPLQPALDVTALNNAIRQLKSALGPLGKDIQELDASEFEKSLKGAATEAKHLADPIDSAADKMRKLEGSGQSLKTTFGEMGKFAGGFVMAQGVELLGQAFQKTVKMGIDFQATMADFSALTGVSGKALDDFGESAKNLSKQFGTSALDQVTAMKGVLSRLGPDIAKSPEALNKMTIAINTLAKASGMDAAQSMDALTTGILQMGVSLDDPVAAANAMTSMMNVMAAGAKEGAAEIPQVSEAMTVAGVSAKQSKLSFEELNASIQVLATGGKYGAEAGTALRNVLSKLAGEDVIPKEAVAKLKSMGVNLDVVSDKTIPFSERLKELNKASSDATAFAQVFGTENAAAAAILANNSDKVADFTQKLTGTSTAFDQAATNMNTFKEQIARAQASIEAFGLDVFNQLSGPATAIIGVISDIATVVYETVKTIFIELWEATKPLRDAFSSLFTAVGNLFSQFGDGKNTLTSITDVFKFLGEIIGNYFGGMIQIATFVIKLFVQAITGIINIGASVISWFKELGKEAGIVGDVIRFIWKGFVDVIGAIGGAIEKILEFFGLLDVKEKKVPINADFKGFNQEIKKLGEEVTVPDIVVGGDGKKTIEKKKKELKDLSKEIEKMTNETAKIQDSINTKQIDNDLARDKKAREDKYNAEIAQAETELNETLKKEDLKAGEKEKYQDAYIKFVETKYSEMLNDLDLLDKKANDKKADEQKKLATKLQELAKKQLRLDIELGLPVVGGIIPLLQTELKSINDEIAATEKQLQDARNEEEKLRLQNHLADLGNMKIDKEKEINDEVKKEQDKVDAEIKKSDDEKKKAAAEKQKADDEMWENTKKSFGMAASLFKEHTAAYKAMAIAEASIATYTAAVKSLELPPPLNWIQFGLIIATGLANVAKIASFATGGRVDEPTLAVIGDASRARPGADTEWIFRDDHIRYIMSEVVRQAMEQQKYMNDRTLPQYLADTMTAAFEKNNSFNKVVKMVEDMKTINEAQAKFYNNEIMEDEFMRVMQGTVTRIKSYAAGGVVDSPELFFAGDAGKNNPEFVLNSPQIKSVIEFAKDQNNKGMEDKLQILINKFDEFEGKIHVLESDIGRAANAYNYRLNRRNK